MLDLSLIIPCYNEDSHIEKSAGELLFSLENTKLNLEIVFIDDCSQDDTRAKLTAIAEWDRRIRVKFNGKNLGRGATVTRGIQESTAKIVGFIDIDLSTQPLYIPYLTQMILNDVVDVATCHRSYKIDMSVIHKVLVRYILSYSYRWMSRNYLGHGLRDTETGFKFFNREKILPVLDQAQDTHWFWDTEIMVYSKLAGLRINEIPSIFVRRPEKPSTVKIVKDILHYFKNMFLMKRRLRGLNLVTSTASAKKKILIYPLRQESPLSGEKITYSFLHSILNETPFHMISLRSSGAASLWGRSVGRLLSLYRIAKADIGDMLIVKVPVASQIPMVQWATRSYRGRMLIWVDGLNWQGSPFRRFIKLMLREPLLSLSRMILNNVYWLKLVDTQKLEIIVSSKIQRNQLARHFPASSVSIYVIPNGSFETQDELEGVKERTVSCRSASIVFGYIGHAYYTKGVYDLLKAYSALKSNKLEFEAKFALSGLGNASFRNLVEKAGYEVEGKVLKSIFYSSIDCLVVPYWTDWGTNVFPNVLIESLQYGIPTVTTNMGVTRELFGVNNLVQMIGPDNLVEELTATLAKIIEGQISLPAPHLLKTHFKDRFAQEIIKTKWLNLLAQPLIDKKR